MAIDDPLITDPLGPPEKSVLTKGIDDKLIDDPLDKADKVKYDDPLIKDEQGKSISDALPDSPAGARMHKGRRPMPESIVARDVEAFKTAFSNEDEEVRIQMLRQLQKDFTKNTHGVAEHTAMTQAVIDSLKDDASTIGYLMNSGKLMTLNEDAMKVMLDFAKDHVNPEKVLAHHLKLSSQSAKEPAVIGVLLNRYPELTVDGGLKTMGDDAPTTGMIPGFMADVRAIENKINEIRKPAPVMDVAPDPAPAQAAAETPVTAPPVMNVAPPTPSAGPVMDAAPEKPAAAPMNVAPESPDRPTFLEEAINRGGTSSLLPNSGRGR